MKVSRFLAAGALVAALAVTASGPVQAGSKGRRNTAAVLGAAAAYEAMQGRGTNALVLGAGAVGAYGRYRDAKDKEDDRYYYEDRGRYRHYDDRYRGDYPRSRRHREYDRYDRSGRYEDQGRYRVRYHRDRDRQSDDCYYLERD